MMAIMITYTGLIILRFDYEIILIFSLSANVLKNLNLQPSKILTLKILINSTLTKIPPTLSIVQTLNSTCFLVVCCPA